MKLSKFIELLVLGLLIWSVAIYGLVELEHRYAMEDRV